MVQPHTRVLLVQTDVRGGRDSLRHFPQRERQEGPRGHQEGRARDQGIYIHTYKVPLQDVVYLRSRGCHELNRGLIIILIWRSYSLRVLQLLYDAV